MRFISLELSPVLYSMLLPPVFVRSWEFRAQPCWAARWRKTLTPRKSLPAETELSYQKAAVSISYLDFRAGVRPGPPFPAFQRLTRLLGTSLVQPLRCILRIPVPYC